MPTTNHLEEELVSSLDSSIDQFNELLSHASTTISQLDDKLRALPSLRLTHSVAGLMELGRRRELYLQHVTKRSTNQGHTSTDQTVCADQLEEHVLSSGNARYGDDVEKTRDLLTRYWRYRQEEITGQRNCLTMRWARYCRTSDTIARTQVEYRRTLVALSEEYDRHQARILRLQRSANPPLPKELENYSIFLLKRQQCNEGLRRFYLHIQWLPYSHRDTIALEIQKLLIAQNQQNKNDEENEENEKGNGEGVGRNTMLSDINGLMAVVMPLLAEYYRGGKGLYGNHNNETWDGKPNVEDDYKTESSFLIEFRTQSKHWNFLPYGAEAEEMQQHEEDDGDGGDDDDDGDVDGEDATPSVPVYIKPATWTPFVASVEEELYHVGHSLSRTCKLSFGNGSVMSVGGSKSKTPEVPSVRNGQENTTRASMDQILLTEFECLHDNDGNQVMERLRLLCSSHVARCVGKTGAIGSSESGRKAANHSSGLEKLMPTLHDRSEKVFERNIGLENQSNVNDLHFENKYQNNNDEDVEEKENYKNKNESKNSKNSDKGMFRTTLIRIMYRQRHLKLRSQRRRLLGLLNYCRSIQRKLTLDHHHQPSQKKNNYNNFTDNQKEQKKQNGNRTSNPSLNLQHELHRTPKDNTTTSNNNINQTNHTANTNIMHQREDEYTTEASTCTFGRDVIHVIDSFGVRIIYDASITDLNVMEQLLLSIGTRYIANSEKKRDRFNEAVVDRSDVLMDLYNCELQLKDAQRKYIDCLLTIYDSTIHIDERKHVASEIMDSMRSRPFHECVEGRTNTNYRVHYELLIATIDSKRALLNKMVTHQITSERKTRNRNVNVVNESHSSRNAMETMFEITLSMGNVARFFPLWNITINQMTENVSNTYLGTTANSSSSNNNNNFNRAVLHSGHVELCALRSLRTMYDRHIIQKRTEDDVRAVKLNGSKSKEDIEMLTNSKSSSWNIEASDVSILLRRHDETDRIEAHAIDPNDEEQKVKAALDGLVRHARDSVGIEKKTKRRVALIDVLLLREECAMERWECLILEEIYNQQCKSFGNDVVHKDRISKNNLFELEDTSFTTTAKIMQLQNSIEGGMASLKQWAVGKLFDPAICRDLTINLNKLLNKIILPDVDNSPGKSVSTLDNAQRLMSISRMRDTLRVQATEKGILSSCVSSNFISLEALNAVETLGSKEYQHRRTRRTQHLQNQNQNTMQENEEEEETDQTFLTKRNVSASEMRATIKTERHRIHDTFCSAYTLRSNIKLETMDHYRIQSDSIISKHHQKNAAAAELTQTLSKNNNKKGGFSNKKSKEENLPRSTRSVSSISALELQLDLTTLKTSTFKNNYSLNILKKYRPYSLRPQIMQQYSTLVVLTSESRNWRKRNSNPILFTHTPYLFGETPRECRKIKNIAQSFTTSSIDGKMQNSFYLPNWYEMIRMTSSTNSEDDDDDDDENRSGTNHAERNRNIELNHLHTLMVHGQLMKKLIQSLFLRCRLMSCGIEENYNDRGTGARMRHARSNPSNKDNDDDNLTSHHVAALDSFCHELNKIKLSLDRMTGSNSTQTSQNDSSNDEEEEEEQEELGNGESILKYLMLRSSIEVSKLRAAFTFTYDQVTGIEQETTIPKRRRNKLYTTISEKEKNALAAGVTLEDWLMSEKIDKEGNGKRITGLHLKVLGVSTSGVVDMTEGDHHHTLYSYDSHLSLSSKETERRKKNENRQNCKNNFVLNGSIGYKERRLNELMSIDQHLEFGHAANGNAKKKGKGDAKGDEETGHSQEEEENKYRNNLKNKSKIPWNVLSKSSPWFWNACSTDTERSYRTLMNTMLSRREDRIRCWGPSNGLVLPTSLSPWYMFAFQRFDTRLTSTLRNYIGAALHCIELRVEGASMVAMSAAAHVNQSVKTKENIQKKRLAARLAARLAVVVNNKG